MPRQTKVGASVRVSDALRRHRVSHARAPAIGGETRARFLLSPDEENLTRAEVAFGVLHLTLHGEWQTRRFADVVLEKDASLPAPAPRVVLFPVERLVGLSAAAIARFGQCPGWFQRKESKPRSQLFKRIPEPPVEGPEVDEIMAKLSGALKENGAALMSLTGRTVTMALGFHTAASWENALASFVSDGFEVVTDRAGANWSGVEWPSGLLRP